MTIQRIRKCMRDIAGEKSFGDCESSSDAKNSRSDNYAGESFTIVKTIVGNER